MKILLLAVLLAVAPTPCGQASPHQMIRAGSILISRLTTRWQRAFSDPF